jgi:hypothetical protein
MAALLLKSGIELLEVKPYFASDYLRFCAPAHVLDLCRQVFLQSLGAADLADTFVIISRKRSEQGGGSSHLSIAENDLVAA